jgi:hypothetical protein
MFRFHQSWQPSMAATSDVFTVTVLNPCTPSISQGAITITPPTEAIEFTYTISQPMKTFQLPAWETSDPECGAQVNFYAPMLPISGVSISVIDNQIVIDDVQLLSFGILANL